MSKKLYFSIIIIFSLLTYILLAQKAGTWRADVILWNLENYSVRYYYQLFSSWKEESCYESIDPTYFEDNPNEHIRIDNMKDTKILRKKIIKAIWRAEFLPKLMPGHIERDIAAPRFIHTEGIKNLARIDRYDIKMESGLKSVVYHFHPTVKNNNLFLFHKGHGTLEEKKTARAIELLLENGYSVVAFHMPYFGPNSSPNKSHNRLKNLESQDLNPLKFFIEPVVVTINYIVDNYTYDHIDMIGISGGGWTTTLAAAIDIRIEHSYPVAGSYPLYLRKPPCSSASEYGDYEQQHSLFRDTASYLDFYILGASGEGRSQTQILIKYDQIFNGLRYRTYENTVRERVRTIGQGDFSVYLDVSQSSHLISETVLRKVLDMRPKNQPIQHH